MNVPEHLNPSTNRAENARAWYATGVGWIEKDAANLGITYLERAIPIFKELGDAARVNRARHHRLLGLQRTERHDEVENEAGEVLAGYAVLGDAYGQALMLCHLAESIVRLGRWERAMVHLNLAEAIAAARAQRPVLRYALERQARLFLERESSVQAVRLFKRVEGLAAEDGLQAEAARMRLAQGAALARMGERGEAVGILEDAQDRYRRLKQPREALEALALLSRIYDSMGQTDEQARVKELMHACGQQVLKRDDERRERRPAGEPPIDPPPATTPRRPPPG